MKKLRVIPSVLMMVACIAVLCIGVLSIKPIENTIGGTINISAAKANLSVSCYINGQQVMAPTKTVGGVDFTIPSEYLNFDVSNVSSAALAPQKVLRVRIENEGNEELGAFFYNSANGLGADGLATFDSLAKELPINNAQGKQVAKATFSPYAHLAPDSYVDLYAIIELTTLSDTADSATFNFDVNVENYVSNVTILDNEIGYIDITTADERLVKLPLSFYNDADCLTFYDENDDLVAEPIECVIPNTSSYWKELPKMPNTVKYLLIPESYSYILYEQPVPSSVEMLQTSTLYATCMSWEDDKPAPFGAVIKCGNTQWTSSYNGYDYEDATENFSGTGSGYLKTLIVNDKNGVEGLFGVSGSTSAKASGNPYTEITGTPWNHTLDNIVFGPDVESLAYKVPAKNVVIPAGLKASAYSDMAINSFVQNLTFGEGITTLGGSIANNTSLKALHLPNSLNTLTTNCKGLTSLDLLYLPDEITTWGTSIFDNSPTYSIGTQALISYSDVIDDGTGEPTNPSGFYFTAFSSIGYYDVIFRYGMGYPHGIVCNSITILSGDMSEEAGMPLVLLTIGEGVTGWIELFNGGIYLGDEDGGLTIVVEAGTGSVSGILPVHSEWTTTWTKTVNGVSTSNVTSLSRDANYDTIFTVYIEIPETDDE